MHENMLITRVHTVGGLVRGGAGLLVSERVGDIKRHVIRSHIERGGQQARAARHRLFEVAGGVLWDVCEHGDSVTQRKKKKNNINQGKANNNS